MKKNLFIATAPNIQKDDILLIIKILFNPFIWKRDKDVVFFEKSFEDYMNLNNEGFKAVAFDSARSSFYALLKAYNFKKGSEILMPSFTCVVIVNSVLFAGLKPVYVDIDKETFNIDFEDLKKKVSSKTKAILIQHTFGKYVDIKKVRKIVGKDTKIIEDTAHILGGKINENGKERRIGTLADASISTFGIEKMMTSCRGGMALVKDGEIYNKLKEMQKTAKNFSYKRIFLWLINPLIWYLITPIYYVGIGKFTIGRVVTDIGHRIKIMGNMVEKCEYRGEFPSWIPANMPGALARLGIHQLHKLDKLNKHRRSISKIYDKEFSKNYTKDKSYTPIRYSVLVKNPKQVHLDLKKEHIVIGNWYERFLFTDEKFLKYLNFDKEKVPNTVFVTKYIINLPTFIHIKPNDAKKIAKKVLGYIM